MQDLLQYILDGLSIGSIYALIALGLVVVYRGTGQINFAQGEMALFSTLVTWWLYDQGLPLLVAIAMVAEALALDVVFEGIEQGVTSILQIIISAVMMFLTNWQLALFVMIPTPWIAAGGLERVKRPHMIGTLARRTKA